MKTKMEGAVVEKALSDRGLSALHMPVQRSMRVHTLAGCILFMRTVCRVERLGFVDAGINGEPLH